MLPWGGHWPESRCICLAEGLLTFSGYKRTVCLWQRAQLLPTTFPLAAPATGAPFVKERAGTFWDLGDWVSGASSVQPSGIGFPWGGETVNAKFTGMNVREQPPSMCRYIVPCQVSSYTSKWWSLFLEDSRRQVWSWDSAATALGLVSYCQ